MHKVLENMSQNKSPRTKAQGQSTFVPFINYHVRNADTQVFWWSLTVTTAPSYVYYRKNPATRLNHLRGLNQRSITNSCQIQRKMTWFCCKSSQLVESNSQRASSLIKEKNISKTRCIHQINHRRLQRLKPGNQYFTTKVCNNKGRNMYW